MGRIPIIDRYLELSNRAEQIISGEEPGGIGFLLENYRELDAETIKDLQKYLRVRLDLSGRKAKAVPVCGYCGEDLDPNAWECPVCGSI